MKKHNKKSAKNSKAPLIIGAVGTGIAALGVFFGKSFKDMKDSAKAQHQVDKANFAAAKAESKANWEAAKAMGRPSTRKAAMQAKRDAEIREANQRRAEAEARIRESQK